MAYLTTLHPIRPGVCIYCQQRTDNLTDEHVIPSGLGGWRVLPEASCDDCRRITHEFETIALRHVLGPGRYWLGIPARKRRQRPKYWPAYKQGEPNRKINIPMAELPFFLCLPTYQTNRPIRGCIPAEHDPVDVDGLMLITEEPAALRAKLNAHGADYLAGKADHIAFARMLAKIALGYCVVEFAGQGFTPAVAPLILGHTTAYRNMVGSSQPRRDQQFPLEQRYEHDLMHKVADDSKLVCVRIDLFRNLGAPSYYVMAGTTGGQVLRFGSIGHGHNSDH